MGQRHGEDQWCHGAGCSVAVGTGQKLKRMVLMPTASAFHGDSYMKYVDFCSWPFLRFSLEVDDGFAILIGFGCDNTAVINILTHRDSVQRGLIQQEYKAMYHEELSHRSSSKLSGHHKKAMSLWILDPARHGAAVLREALSAGTVDLRAATEIICSRTPSQLYIMKQTSYAT